MGILHDIDLIEDTTQGTVTLLPSSSKVRMSHLSLDNQQRRGCGQRADLASASLARLRAGETSDGRFVSRRKDH